MRVKINNLSFAYSQKLILNKVSFSLKSGDFLTIIGKNGTGKSTFIKCLLKLLKTPDDTIYLDDIDINKMSKLYNIGYVPQKADFNYEFPISVCELLSCAYQQKKDAYYTSIINILDLNTIYRENINNLSGGQLQRIFIARALLSRPKLLVLDEPTVGVDQDNLKALFDILKKLKSESITIILITHDIDFATKLTDYYLSFNESNEYSFTEAGDFNVPIK